MTHISHPYAGNAPLVIARGGYSGIFPGSSQFAYQFALATSLKETVLLCDLQLTKDGAGICLSNLKLDNSTTISTAFPKRDSTYSVNGQSLHGWFSVDFTSDELLSNVTSKYIVVLVLPIGSLSALLFACWLIVEYRLQSSTLICIIFLVINYHIMFIV